MCGTTSICFLRSTQFGFAWGLLLVAMCGCDLVDSGGAAGYAAESSQKEDGIPEDDIDPSCHYSCAMGRSCEDGQVLRYPGGAVPCEYWTGSQCDPIVEYTCLEGCAFRDSEEVVCTKSPGATALAPGMLLVPGASTKD